MLVKRIVKWIRRKEIFLRTSGIHCHHAAAGLNYVVDFSLSMLCRAYDLPAPELMRLDNHLADTHFNRTVFSNFFDAIVTDPLYGIRAGARKSGLVLLCCYLIVISFFVFLCHDHDVCVQAKRNLPMKYRQRIVMITYLLLSSTKWRRSC